ncbi:MULTISPECIES: hypothetical protein [unclassified Acinetobacter]|uniref:hypothetical protein n=1 Tax=unclassified Acinetobacter TaxID=196816 RepID=UPI002578E926|nr:MULTISPECIES: hypothetical protein [unclassified Acinetobacter]MDM1763855.1 hypothetical protein [Acinetobacter sp. 226-1]MDM1767589.1 hypothetical protein [Acinetobacter sp. 226-4]
MKAFFLNFTLALEKNPKIYWSVIIGVALCLALYIAEIIHIQTVFSSIQSQDRVVVRAIIDPLAQRYHWGRMAVMILAVIWANLQYFKTKKQLKL